MMMSVRCPRAGVTVLILGVLLGAACSPDEPPQHLVYPDLSGPRRDGYKPFWPDGNGWRDRGQRREAGAADRRVSDGRPAGDGQAGCAVPTSVVCSNGCPGGEICTEAKGGACVKRLILTGPATDKAALAAVALAYVRCWDQDPSDDQLCATFDTCAMTGVLTEAAISDWVCSKAGITDFPTADDYDTARGVCRCSTWQGELVYRPDWKVSSIVAGQNGIVCLSYDKRPWYEFDRLNVNDCQAFPPL